MGQIIEVEDLTVNYREKTALRNINLEIPSGILMAIVGPDGAGKSALIKTMVNLIKPISGRVVFWGSTYEEMIRNIAYIPKRESVDWDFPINVFDLVMMGRYGDLELIERPKKLDNILVTEAIEKMGMTEFSNKHIGKLTAGQQQRAFLARGLAQNAEIYFMDEPFQWIDVKTQDAVINLLKDLKYQGKTVIVVHHELETVDKYFDYVTLLNKEVIASGAVEEVFTDENIRKAYTTSFVSDRG